MRRLRLNAKADNFAVIYRFLQFPRAVVTNHFPSQFAGKKIAILLDRPTLRDKIRVSHSPDRKNMTAITSADVGMSEFSFYDGELRITTRDLEMKIRGWPDPHAAITTGHEIWRDFRPAFRLLKPLDGRALSPSGEMDGVVGKGNLEQEPLLSRAKRKESAFEAFRASIPPAIVSVTERFQSHQWNLIDLADKKSQTLDLLAINPVLAFCLANCDQFRRWISSTPAIQASHIAERKQRDILGWLGFPATEAVVRIFKKLQPEAIAPSEARMLRNAINSEPSVLKLLAHQPIINTGILGIISNLKLLSGVSPNLLTAVGADEREAAYPHTAERLLDILWMLWELHRRPILPRFESMESLRECHDALTQDYLRTIEELRNQRKARMEAKRRKPAQARKPIPDFQPPPLPGTDDIIPLTSIAQLRAEGRSQRNCVGTYGRRVRSGSIYIYKVLRPERATLAVTKGAGGFWTIAELEGAGNKATRAATRAAINRWLALHSMSL